MVSEVLRQNGYSTAWFGKNHNVPDWETSISGPYDRWPTRQGFDHFYGFIGGEANQWAPALYRDNTPIEMEAPKGREADFTRLAFQWKSGSGDRITKPLAEAVDGEGHATLSIDCRDMIALGDSEAISNGGFWRSTNNHLGAAPNSPGLR
jgi:arylsulfatase A-like enzyme